MKVDNAVREQLHTTALKAPSSSGVYLWRNSDGVVIYVGKAKNLKNRLSSYFAGKKDIKTRMLVSNAASIEYIVTGTEYEAFILENTLIKQHRPKYNIDLKDDKSYPSLRVTSEDFPRIFKTRYIVQDGSRYFGPFPNAYALDTFIEYLYQRYPLRHCKKFRKRNSPCMYYHIGRCSAPCCGKIDKDTYIDNIDEICGFLDGNPKETVEKMRSEMKTAAKELKFEKAARIRDGITAVEELHAVNTVSDYDTMSRDYIGCASEGPLVSFAVLKMRGGRLVARDLYRTTTLHDEADLLPEFFAAYYDDEGKIPATIVVPELGASDSDNGLEFARRWIFENYNLKPDIIAIAHDAMKTASANGSGELIAAEGEAESTAAIKTRTESPELSRHKPASAMAMHNAREDIIRRVRERGDIPALEELQKLLALDHLPARIEGFDIAHLHGQFPVASLISFYNGNPDKKNYRYFRLKTTDGIIDDFASMREATSRRYTRLLNEGAELPDLILIDGGIGQVNAVEGVLDALGVDIPIIGLAKRDEEIYLPHQSTPISLPKRSDALRLLQRVRDETHRFATSRNQRLRTKANTEGAIAELKIDN